MIYSTEVKNNGNSNWLARASSAEICRILEENPRGSVHSVFNNSFNLIFGHHLVHVGAMENGLAPFGIGLYQQDAQRLTQQVRNGQQVTWEARTSTLIFTGGLSLSLEQVELMDHLLSDHSFDRAILHDNFQYIADRLLRDDWQIGLAQTDEDKKVIIHYLLSSSISSSHSPIVEELECLEKLARGDTTADAERVFNFWIGRGIGLTPSGDDIITGICAVISALEGTNKAFQQRLRPYLLEHGQKRTTHIALEYLMYATEDKYHSKLIQMGNVIGKPQKSDFVTGVEEMKKIGHTSGADTLVGMLLGVKALDVLGV